MNDTSRFSTNKAYELEDHKFRDSDHYALGKYNLTLRWLINTGHLSGKSLLNVGAGAGHFNVMAANLGLKVFGIEPDAEAFQLALDIVGDRDIEIRNSDLESLDPGLTFDYIVMHDVLEHIEDDKKVVAELSRRLKKGGTLVLSVPALQALYGMHDQNLGHHRRYGKGQLIQLLRQEFKVEYSRYYGFVFIPLVYFLSVVLRKPYPVKQVRGGVASKILDYICRLETKFSPPVGTSIIVRARK